MKAKGFVTWHSGYSHLILPLLKTKSFRHRSEVKLACCAGN